jgi:hypothetical protein
LQFSINATKFARLICCFMIEAANAHALFETVAPVKFWLKFVIIIVDLLTNSID